MYEDQHFMGMHGESMAVGPWKKQPAIALTRLGGLWDTVREAAKAGAALTG